MKPTQKNQKLWFETFKIILNLHYFHKINWCLLFDFFLLIIHKTHRHFFVIKNVANQIVSDTLLKLVHYFTKFFKSKFNIIFAQFKNFIIKNFILWSKEKKRKNVSRNDSTARNDNYTVTDSHEKIYLKRFPFLVQKVHISKLLSEGKYWKQFFSKKKKYHNYQFSL